VIQISKVANIFPADVSNISRVCR